MTPQEFDVATPQERNEAIAPFSGLVREDCEKHPGEHYFWRDPVSLALYSPESLPDFQGDDGLAFRELWPKILKMERSGSLCKLATGEATFIWLDYAMTADTWAKVLCKAFLKFSGEGPTTAAPLASEGAASKGEGD